MQLHQTSTVRLRPAKGEDNLAIRRLKVKPCQQIFSGKATDFAGKMEDGIRMHVIENNGQVVGVFRVDQQFQYSFTFASFDTPGVGDFIVDEESQGQGIGTQTCRLLSQYLPEFHPRARGVYLLVNTRNLGAYKAFVRGGFMDSGEQYSRGPTGPQHVLYMPF